MRSSWPWERQLPRLPQAPGVYSFLSQSGKVLYVGKARNLKRRVSSYTHEDLNPRTKLLLIQAKRLKWIRCASDLEAILAEAELVRTHQPKFNVRLKDDKSPLYIQITSEEFPRILLVRKPQGKQYQKQPAVFGPFTSRQQARQVLRIVRRAFPFCNSTPSQKQHKIACFYYHLGLCPGACVGKIDKTSYRKIINNLSAFFLGKKRKLMEDMTKQMTEAIRSLNFEQAAELRDQIRAIENIVKREPTLAWTEEEPERHNQLKARQLLWKILSPFYLTETAEIPQSPFERIEAYDISSLTGKHAAGAMVVFSDGRPDPQNYRLFKIRFTTRPDDLTMLAEMLLRRFRHREWQLPQLILIDGGKGQVKTARSALASYGLHHQIPILGIAKRNEELIVYKHIFHILEIPRHSAALHLLMQLRDEAHRFARNYHLALRQRTISARTGTLNIETIDKSTLGKEY